MSAATALELIFNQKSMKELIGTSLPVDVKAPVLDSSIFIQ